MPAKEKKTKAQIAAAAAAGSRSKKKKWGKGKKVDKARNAVFFDEPLYAKMRAEIPKSKLITPHTVADRLKITVSLARVAIKGLETEGLVKRVSDSPASMIYTRV
eukprot:Blabericola_migrator_1__477@NODE_1115_length_5385_cov_108_807634_g762_i0_p3_GENE_NODE_1115_length_5385_cov_108_807634_g762_i0NODE_1115_length_5385_cov_108_807634_g762_i0_p3_ORF_typecomplete_len105_score33_51Ribosomal_S25/PF03297_15/1_9e31GntR/PF00392_21/0_0018MarR/PF01047_22/0_0024DUF4423/PF14394_6/0_0021HTH_27/PF13463_6/5_6e03HTH_27/PF13463_6/0_006DUF2250/PF10007_9/5_4e03DUF2250/PF10007_9/0_0046MarR_2/PF12802_7/0_0059TrmB/PF01978_19/0_027FaeA/PF04703_12/0_068Rrf2/PF02082_20/1_4e04Rrf2/PF02082_2